MILQIYPFYKPGGFRQPHFAVAQVLHFWIVRNSQNLRIHVQLAFFSPPQRDQLHSCLGCFSMVESPRSNVFYGKWPRKLRQLVPYGPMTLCQGKPKDGDLPKSSPGPIQGQSQNGTTEVIIFGLVLWPLPWIKLWYLPESTIGFCSAIETHRPRSELSTPSTAAGTTPGVQLVPLEPRPHGVDQAECSKISCGPWPIRSGLVATLLQPPSALTEDCACPVKKNYQTLGGVHKWIPKMIGLSWKIRK